MTWVRVIHEHEADGELAALYERLNNRVANIIKSHSLKAEVLKAHLGAALRALTKDDDLVAGLKRDYRTLNLPSRWMALLTYAEKLTLRPREMAPADLEPLRAEGLSDRDIVDLNQEVAYFHYVNRVADGLGVELEPEYVAEDR